MFVSMQLTGLRRCHSIRIRLQIETLSRLAAWINVSHFWNGSRALPLIASQPFFEMSNVFASKRIGQAAHVCSVKLGFTRHEVLLQDAPMNRHVPLTQAQSAVNELNEQLAR
jgi:hypothetical protein